MADFPSKVTTETSAPSQQGGNSLRGVAANVTTKMDMSFIRSIPAILMIAEIVLGLLHWSLVASVVQVPALGWVLFVSVTAWLITTILFFVILFGAQRHLTFIPLTLTVMVYHGVTTVLYLTAFAVNAAYVTSYYFFFYGHMAAASFFAAVVTVAYGGSAFFSYLDWKGDEGNAATNTVPT